MVGSAQGRKIPHLIAPTGASILNMMKIKISRRATAGDRAAMVVAREYLAPDAIVFRPGPVAPHINFSLGAPMGNVPLGGDDKVKTGHSSRNGTTR